MAEILLVEDDAGVREALSRALGARAHRVTAVPAGLASLQVVLDRPIDLVLLDLGLPDVDGLQVVRMLRAVSQSPIVVVTGRCSDDDVVAALDAGASDYVVKPISAEQLDARIRAVLRRHQVASPDLGAVVRAGGLALDPACRAATLDGQPLDLSRLEFDLLLALARRVGEVVTKAELLADVWGLAPVAAGGRTVDVHLSWLRRKLGETAAAPRYLWTVRGVGVRLFPPTHDSAPGCDSSGSPGLPRRGTQE